VVTAFTSSSSDLRAFAHIIEMRALARK